MENEEKNHNFIQIFIYALRRNIDVDIEEWSLFIIIIS